MKKIVILLSVFVFLSCGSKNNNEKNAESDLVEEGADVLKLSNLNMNIPASWNREAPTGQMRIAQLAYADDPDVKIVVFYFGQQDMVEANVQRWKNQFVTLVSEQKLEVTDENVTGIKLTGVFKKKNFPMAQEFTEVPGYAMLAAIVPSTTGPYYFKVVAPEPTIEKIESDFLTLINSNK